MSLPPRRAEVSRKEKEVSRRCVNAIAAEQIRAAGVSPPLHAADGGADGLAGGGASPAGFWARFSPFLWRESST